MIAFVISGYHRLYYTPKNTKKQPFNKKTQKLRFTSDYNSSGDIQLCKNDRGDV